MKLHRSLLNKPIWTEATSEQKVILITLLMMANYEERQWEWGGKFYLLQPGQFVTSLPTLVQRCGKGVTVQKIRTALKRFEAYGFLTDESTNQNRLITIVNWGFYQRNGCKVTGGVTGNRHTYNRQLTTTKKERTKNIEIERV
ncbi:hypothetical protein [Sporosarcina luteola]|uniref:hypothetical protein n=1 Tax=Sporosarcina luteola TaxID=582850 RepID=UPI00203B5AA5|nr:hypothetical protein [Sporosarcina luteola]MCM3711502.1 hypothetical protein [Sporosarcina luteola]